MPRRLRDDIGPEMNAGCPDSLTTASGPDGRRRSRFVLATNRSRSRNPGVPRSRRACAGGSPPINSPTLMPSRWRTRACRSSSSSASSDTRTSGSPRSTRRGSTAQRSSTPSTHDQHPLSQPRPASSPHSRSRAGGSAIGRPPAFRARCVRCGRGRDAWDSGDAGSRASRQAEAGRGREVVDSAGRGLRLSVCLQ